MDNKNNLKIRNVEIEVKGKKILFDEYYVTDSQGNEIFDRDIEIENDKRLYDIYKKQNNLLTISEIKNIRNKYELNQKEYAQAIGVGEITVHRFENGSIQTEAVDSIMRLSNDPNNMRFLIIQNRKNLSEELYQKISLKVKELINLKEHALMDFNETKYDGLIFKSTDVKTVARNTINIYNNEINRLVEIYGINPEYITHLKLQKLLYYIQAYALLFFDKKAFNEPIMAWAYGPVVEEIYHEYKENHANEIILNAKDNIEEISIGLRKIIEQVILTYGGIEATKLIDFTHDEEPWKNTVMNSEIKTDLIKEYFYKVYNN